MTPQEKQALQDFLDQLTRAQAGTKDLEAQALIARAFALQPDAAYLVVQRALLLEQALKQAQSQISQRQEQRSSFIGNGLAPAPSSGAAPALANGGWGSFLGNAAATAAGVAGGAFLFQGLEHLFGHGGSAFPGGDVPPETVENVTVNNNDDADTLPDQDLSDSDDDSSWT